VKAKRGTLDAMCDEFLKWMEGQVEAGNLSQLTLNSRRTGLSQACETKDPQGDRIGSLDADLPREAFVYIRDKFGGRTGAAATCLKALRAAYKWGKDRGYPANSPVFGVESGHKPKGGATSWSAEDVEKFLKAHGPGAMARLWFCLAYATHGRIGDAPFLGPGNEAIHDGDRYLEWQPRKSGSAFVSIPLDDMLAEELKNHEARDTYLVTEYGRPFASSGSLDNRVRKWIVAAGLVGENGKANRSQHGIRKGVAELMAANGATEYELMSAFGWTEAKTASVYTKNFQRRGAARSAHRRASGAQGGPRS
jgi:integrase